ncbi:type II toxin-antitoxin system RelB/DinJ family antitoxin [Bartonella sp. CB178]|uniref:type II toxin-antitoxin system RelB/DinJ family antitoxin n=1 Tax=Bartonella sp. CB178 TaxID=3112255 RepID=UPI00300DDFB6
MAKIQARVPDEIQDIANAVIKSTGLTVSDVIRVLMTNIAKDQALPLHLFQPNAETLQSIKDAETGHVQCISLDGLRTMIRSYKEEHKSEEKI